MSRPTDVEVQIARPMADVRRLLRNPRNKALRAAYRKQFPPVMGFFTQYAADAALCVFWIGFVMDNTSRGDWMMDGFLTGEWNGDC